MAIDTRNKRASCLGYGEDYGVAMPNPDGLTPSASDRRQMLASYAGASGGGPEPEPGETGTPARGRLAERWIGRRGRAIK